MLKLIIPFLIAFATINLQGQPSYFEPGFLVMLNGDTTKGYVERLRDDKLAERVFFKNQLQQKDSTAYMPFEIKGFGFHDPKIFFESAEFQHRTATNTTKFNRFAKQMVAGQASLYILELSDAEIREINLDLTEFNHVFLLKKDGAWSTLDQYVSYNKELKKDLVVPRYIGVLKLVLQDCPTLNDQLDKLRYNESDMITTVINYNKCRYPNQPVLVMKYKSPTIWNFGAEGSLLLLLKDEKRKSAEGWSLGIFARRYNISQNEKMWATFGLNIFRINYENGGNTHIYKGFRIPVMVNFFAGSRTIKPYIGTGFTLSNQFFYLNIGAGIEAGKTSIGLLMETNPLRLGKSILASLRASRYF